MRAAPILLTRRALVAYLKADSSVTGQLPAAQIFGERAAQDTPWPFSRMGEFEGTRRGQDIRGNVHVFSKGDFTDEVASLVELIATSLDSAVLTLSDGSRCVVTIEATRILPDPEEQSAWHGIIELLATIEADCTDN